MATAKERFTRLIQASREILQIHQDFRRNFFEIVSSFEAGIISKDDLVRELFGELTRNSISEEAITSIISEEIYWKARAKENARAERYRQRQGYTSETGAKGLRLRQWQGNSKPGPKGPRGLRSSASLPVGSSQALVDETSQNPDTPALSFEDSLAQAEAAKLDATRQAIAEELAKNSFDF